jgi:hypothetical protein
MIEDWSCPCGDKHENLPMAHEALEVYRGIGLSPIVQITIIDRGAWRIPRAYVAFHGIAAAEAAKLAEKYGWEKVA